MAKKLIGQYLVEMGAISQERLEFALSLQAEEGQGTRKPLIGTVLMEMCGLKEDGLKRALDQQDADDWHGALDSETEGST